MDMEFKKQYKDGLFNYLHVDNASYGDMAALEGHSLSDPSQKAIDATVYKDIFYRYLALAEFFSKDLGRYCMVPFSPDLQNQKGYTEIGPSLWRYEMLSSDSAGLGVDHGFYPQQDKGGPSGLRLFATDSFTSLSNLPEDLFGETSSQCSLFGLPRTRQDELARLMQRGEKPALPDFMHEGEVFLHLIVSKQVGVYNALLIKSKTDIEGEINAFLNVVDSSN